MKKNILLGLMLLSAVPVFSADLESGGSMSTRSSRARSWISAVLPMKYVTHQTVYATAGSCGAYTVAHCAGSSDGWLRCIGLGGLCSGLYLGNRHYRSAEHETGILTGARDAAQQLAADRLTAIGLRDTAIGNLRRDNGVLEGERNAANNRVIAADQRLTVESQRHATAEAESALRIQELSGTVAEGLGEVQRTLGVNQGGLRVLLGAQIATIRSSRVNSIAAGVTLRGVGQNADADEAAAAVLELDSVLSRLRALQGQAQNEDLLALS